MIILGFLLLFKLKKYLFFLVFRNINFFKLHIKFCEFLKKNHLSNFCLFKMLLLSLIKRKILKFTYKKGFSFALIQ